MARGILRRGAEAVGAIAPQLRGEWPPAAAAAIQDVDQPVRDPPALRGHLWARSAEVVSGGKAARAPIVARAEWLERASGKCDGCVPDVAEGMARLGSAERTGDGAHLHKVAALEQGRLQADRPCLLEAARAHCARVDRCAEQAVGHRVQAQEEGTGTGKGPAVAGQS